jgi:hypothetical protein
MPAAVKQGYKPAFAACRKAANGKGSGWTGYSKTRKPGTYIYGIMGAIGQFKGRCPYGKVAVQVYNGLRLIGAEANILPTGHWHTGHTY